MEDIDLEKYKRLHDLANEMAEIVLQDKSPEGYEHVNRFLLDEENQININRRFERAGEIDDIYVKVALRNKTAEVDQLKYKIRLLEDQCLAKRRKLKQKVSLSIAAAVIVVSVILVPLIGKKDGVSMIAENRKSEVAKKQSVKLIFENGEEKLLGDNKNISLGGVEIAKTAGNKLTYEASDADSVMFATIVVPNEKRYIVELEDGTEVYLSANSSLKYPSSFAGKERRVELTGEAFFKVTKSRKQFIVKASDVEVLVYGTQFNINSYDKNAISTTLLSGSVGVKYNENGQRRELKITPNQSLTVENGAAHIVTDVNIKRHMAWLDGYFRSDEEPLRILLREIENWYGVDLVYSDAVGDRLISASLNSNMPVDSLLRMLQISTNVKVLKVGDKYSIK